MRLLGERALEVHGRRFQVPGGPRYFTETVASGATRWIGGQGPFEVAAGLVRAIALKQKTSTGEVGFHRGERLIQLVANSRRHLT